MIAQQCQATSYERWHQSHETRTSDHGRFAPILVFLAQPQFARLGTAHLCGCLKATMPKGGHDA